MQGALQRTLAFFVLAGLPAWGVAAEPEAPLEITKQELRQLQRDQKIKSAGAGDTLKVDSSAFGLSQPGVETPQQWLSQRLQEEREAKQRQHDLENKNWLVEGVERLDRKDSAGKNPEGEPGEKRAGIVDRSDPQYLLHLFEEQRKSGAGKTADKRTTKTAANDPWTPLLQEWLGTSPIRGQFFDRFAGGGSTERPATGEILPQQVGPTARTGAVEHGESGTKPAPNPYLVDVGRPVSSPGSAAQVVPATGSAASANPLPAKPAEVLAPQLPVPEVRTQPVGLPPNPADDRKYFPQLKRF